MRKIIISISGIVILIVGLILFNVLSNSKKEPEKNDVKDLLRVYVQSVKNTSIPISITTSGSILAKERMEIYAEVEGIFTSSSKLFKAGEKYRKGEPLVKINSDEYRANVISQRASFKSLVTSILADIKFDYSSSFEKWNTYLNSIDIQKKLPKLPTTESDEERNYLSGKNIDVNYYNIKNLETHLNKYTIVAPYSGALTDAAITPGSLVNKGQKLGEFIKPNIFELELNVNANLQDFLTVGKTVSLTNINHTESYTGKVTRINETIDRSSQTIKIFVEVVSKKIKEGEYLEANIHAQEADDAIEVSRALLVENKAIYIVENGKIHIEQVDIFYSNLNTVIIKGLKNGVQFVSQPITGAFEDMDVKIIKD